MHKFFKVLWRTIERQPKPLCTYTAVSIVDLADNSYWQFYCKSYESLTGPSESRWVTSLFAATDVYAY